ncbi:MAG: 2-succinyl-6-hydroxy-2,4-cyclohexadiene-1-carboxylate synthase [Candidatus Binatia bacterium]
MPRVCVGDVTLHAAVAGAGAPLILLHGFTGSGAQWSTLVEAFPDRFRTIAVDLLGHGRSDVPADPERYRMERCVMDLALLLDALGVRRACWLGYSMGARVALAFALTHPERVSALVLEGVSPGIEDPTQRRDRILHDETLADRIERDGIEPFVDAWMQQPLFASQVRLGPAALAAARAARCANSPVGLANSLRGMGTGAQEPLWARLSTVTVPALLVVGEEDVKFRALADAMSVRMPAVEVAVIPEAGHAAHLENPAAFNACVRRFLTKESRGKAGDEPRASVA